MNQKYLNPTQKNGKAFLDRGIKGEVIMLNLLKFKTTADYSETPELDSAEPITGEVAYQLYISHTFPFLKKSGGEILFYGKGGNFLIGPDDEAWDAVMLVKQKSVDNFMAFATDAEYLTGIGHRIAALEDSRLLPMIENPL